MNDLISTVINETMEHIIQEVENDHFIRESAGSSVIREISPDPEWSPGIDPRLGPEETEKMRVLEKIQELQEKGCYSRDFIDCSCERCGFHQQEIRDRIRREDSQGVCSDSQRRLFSGDFLSVKDMGSPGGAELICHSCSIDEYHHINDQIPARWCVSCQVSNKIKDSNGKDMSDTGRLSGDRWYCYKCCIEEAKEAASCLGMDVEYDDDDPEPYSLPRISCPQCGASSDEYCGHHPYAQPERRTHSSDVDLVLCESCGREWDGNAQCPCGIGHFIDTHGDGEIATTWGQVSSWIEEYEGEYEVVDNSPENNSEVATEIKDAVKELGEQLFESKEKLSEGEYLKMMDLLQEITNKTNSL